MTGSSSTGRTIGVVVGGVVLAGALGGLASALAGGDGFDTARPHATGRGVAPAAAPPSAVSPGDVAPSAVPTTLASAVPSAAPSAGPTGIPSAFPSATPTPSATTDPAPGGDTVTIGEGLEVHRPGGWRIDSRDATSVAMSDGDGSFAYAFTGTVDPATEASAVISDSLDDLLPGDTYSRLRIGRVDPIEPFGSLVSASSADYQTLWVDAQAAVPLHGQAYAAIRQDGTALVILVEHSPPDDFTTAFDALAPIVNATLSDFGGS